MARSKKINIELNELPKDDQALIDVYQISSVDGSWVPNRMKVWYFKRMEKLGFARLEIPKK